MIRLQRSELTEQIGKVNLKIATANKELEELELKYKKKKLEIRKYKNEMSGLKLELQELDLNNWKEQHKQEKIKNVQKQIMKKYADPNNEYYSQEKKFLNTDDLYTNYMERNVLPYLD